MGGFTLDAAGKSSPILAFSRATSSTQSQN